MARKSSVGSGRFELQFSLDGVNWNSSSERFDTRARAIKDAQSARKYLPAGTVFRTIVSEVEEITPEELNRVRTRKMSAKEEVEPGEIMAHNRGRKANNQ